MAKTFMMLVLGAAAIACQPSGTPASPSNPPTRCEPGGSFSAPDHRGALVDVPSAESKAVVVEIWARWCEPCRTAVPELLEHRGDLEGDQIRVVLLGVVEEGETIEDARATLSSWGVDQPFVIDRGGAMMRRFGFADLPATVVLDGQGNIRWTSEKGSTADDIVAAARAASSPCSP
jgi:thiol-disulfide isomerase/thioredoxin